MKLVLRFVRLAQDIQQRFEANDSQYKRKISLSKEEMWNLVLLS